MGAHLAFIDESGRDKISVISALTVVITFLGQLLRHLRGPLVLLRAGAQSRRARLDAGQA
jgi:hypothetical protein